MRVRHLPFFACVVHTFTAGSLVIGGQGSESGLLEQRLKRLFPTAATFSAKEGNPPHFTVYGSDAQKAPVGYAFWTIDLEPLERGYDGPIQMLVGIDVKGMLTGVVVTAHREPYGYFSVDKPEFAKQFVGKDVRSPFKVGADVEAISRATITVNSATRSIRNGARKIARALLTPPDAAAR
ncbi:MAG: FMN-binding protein [Acidimicrobiia bacterium]|nr:FMN-binding protein [Acidimicrobiia bacterium]